MANVGHAATNEYLVDLVALYFRQQTRVVGIIRRTDDRLVNFGQIDLDHGSVFGVLIRF